ncbi:MAG TPA: hypothetical protein ENJ53_02165 [Phaeodactylibacter sp.]|nr:hypothetical protein [Phaeodactylibacter sp.]
MKNFKKLLIFFSGVSGVSASSANTAQNTAQNTTQKFLSFSLVFLAILAVLALQALTPLPLTPLKATSFCGPLELEFEGYSFINPEIVNTKATYAPYFLRFNDLYRYYDTLEQIQEGDNLQEWSERFCNLYSKDDLRTVIYKATARDIKRLRNAANDKKAALPVRIKNNSFAFHLRDEKCLEVIDYLIFAKQCERHVVVGEGWSTPKRNVEEMLKMIIRGKRAFMKTASYYVRLRYAYQIIRLAHYAKKYQLTLDLYDELMPKIHANPSLIDYWILGHKAGALLKLGKNVEASYLYSLIFAHSRSKRQSAFQSFSIKNNKEWEQLLKRCKSDAERAMLYAIRANEDGSNEVEEMGHIYELDAHNENLELLLVKEIIKIERDLLGKDFNDNRKRNERYFHIPRKKAGEHLIRLKTFVKKILKEKKVARYDLWRIAEGYLTFLAGDYYEANQTFAKIQKTLKTKNKALEEQLEVAQLALNIAQLDSLNQETENGIGDIMRENPLYWKYKDFPDYINDKLGAIYKKTGEKGKAFRLHYSLRALKLNPDLEIINDLLRICDKKNKSSLEAALVKKDGLTTIKSDLLKLKGIVLFNKGEIEAAAVTFRKIPRNDRDVSKKFNPFHEHIIDCVHCPIADTLLYDRVGIVDRILKLEYDGRAHLENGAASFYQLGNAYYNMTYFGSSWYVTDLFRSGANWKYVNKNNRYFTYESDRGNVENMDMSRAKKYYETTLELAKNKELAARACFMLAKCNLNEFYLDKDTEYHPFDNKIPVLPEKYNAYYLQFKKEYSDTEFYREAIEECLFLKAY